MLHNLSHLLRGAPLNSFGVFDGVSLLAATNSGALGSSL